MSLFNELKRRNVFRVTIAYVVIAWLVAQVLQMVFESFGTPDWVMKTLLVLLATGLPFAVFFSWAFEITPEGLKREHEVDRSQTIPHETSRKLDFIIIGMMALALAYFAYDKLVLSAERDAALVEATTQAVSEQADTEEVSTESDKSIAVLPFVNMSDEASNEYFSDGISEELLNLLVKIPELRVAARTSSFSYKGKGIKITQIGEELNVAHVLEGSVRKSGNQVRITAQLVKTDDGFHLWSETYDRTLDNIFAIQDEIASAVVAQLKIILLGDAPIVRETDPEAYALVLHARYLVRQSTRDGLEKSIGLLEQALAIDPDYAVAWAGLARVYINETNQSLRSHDEGYTLAREAANHALAIDPEYALAHESLAQIAMYYDRDLVVAARHYQQALTLDPANTDRIFAAANMAASLGRLDQAIALAEYAVARDPVNPVGVDRLGIYYLYAGRLDEAITSLRTALALSPESLGTNYLINTALLLKGEPEAALEVIQKETSETKRLYGLVVAYHALGQTAASDTALADLIEQYEQTSAYNIAYILAYRGEADRAFEWLQKAVAYNDPGLTQTALWHLFANIHEDPRWLPFLESIGKSPRQLAAIGFKVTLPE